MPSRPSKWNRPPSKPDRLAGKCHSPHCAEPPLRGGKWCPEHQKALNRCKPKPPEEKPDFSEVKISHIAPEPRPKEAKAAKGPRVSAGEFRDRIKAALAAGSLPSVELASACGSHPSARTYSRARRAMIDAGELVDVGQSGRSKIYALAATPVAPAPKSSHSQPFSHGEPAVRGLGCPRDSAAAEGR